MGVLYEKVVEVRGIFSISIFRQNIHKHVPMTMTLYLLHMPFLELRFALPARSARKQKGTVAASHSIEARFPSAMCPPLLSWWKPSGRARNHPVLPPGLPNGQEVTSCCWCALYYAICAHQNSKAFSLQDKNIAGHCLIFVRRRIVSCLLKLHGAAFLTPYECVFWLEFWPCRLSLEPWLGANFTKYNNNGAYKIPRQSLIWFLFHEQKFDAVFCS